jgi:GNAT superfamily N-acetyltransferase
MIELRTGDRRAAFDVPFNVYDAASPYISPMWSDFDRFLDPARNPLAREGRGAFALFTAHRDGRPVGRIVAAMHEASNQRHGTRRGQFGFFDCADDPEAATALLQAAEAWVCERGAEEIAGNFNLTAMQMAGVLTEGFENAPYTDMMWSPPHIARLLERAGYAPFFPMTTFETDLTRVDPASLVGPKQAAILADTAYTWRPIRRRDFKASMEEARVVLNDGFDRNPMFVPVSIEEYAFQAGEMMWVMDPRLSVVVHHGGKPAGVIVCIPDLNPFVRACRSRLSLTTPWHFLKHRFTGDRAVIIYYSVAPRLHGAGLNGAMLSRLVAAAKSAGYRRLGTTWIGDVNQPSLRQMQRLGAAPLHRLHLFRKPLPRGGAA